MTLTPDMEALRAALRPFAILVDGIDPGWSDERRIITLSTDLSKLRVGDLRRAAEAYAAIIDRPVVEDVTIAKFKKQTYGAVVATIYEDDTSIVEVQQRNDGMYGLIIHTRKSYGNGWDDLTAYLKPEHYDALGSVARHMRGEPECCRGLAPKSECSCDRAALSAIPTTAQPEKETPWAMNSTGL